jgi:hypothetical protein
MPELRNLIRFFAGFLSISMALMFKEKAFKMLVTAI